MIVARDVAATADRTSSITAGGEPDSYVGIGGDHRGGSAVIIGVGGLATGSSRFALEGQAVPRSSSGSFARWACRASNTALSSAPTNNPRHSK